jgi:hypothetical protein
MGYQYMAASFDGAGWLPLASYEAEVDHGQESISHHPNAIFALRMHHKGSHAKLLASISEMEDVYVVHDI